MKQFISLFFCLLSISVFAQKNKLIQKKIYVNPDKTTFLIFGTSESFIPDSIVYYDLGSDMVGYAKTKQKNIARIKPVSKNFPETNLTVLTESGQYYSFLINYTAKPDTLNYFFTSEIEQKATPTPVTISTIQDKKSAKPQAVKLSHSEVTDLILNRSSGETARYPVLKYKIGLALKGVYINNNTLYFHLAMVNTAMLPFDVDFAMFTVQDKKKLKASTDQEGELAPVYTYPSASFTVKPKEKPMDIIMAFNQFTFDSDKKLLIEVWEKNENRKINIQLSSSDILRAKQL